MGSEVINTTLDAEMGECDEDKVVTMMDVLQEQEDFEEDANAVLGASDDKNCTYSKGYIKRQAIYACLTCCTEAKSDPAKRAGVCLACSLTCHENHELIELYTKRNFRCDCGNPKFNSHLCQYTSNKTDLNDDNNYNQNFSGLYCICQRPYPDPESTVEDEMIQCIICEDWLHALHLEASIPASDQYSEMICKHCMEKNEFLHDYNSFVVNTENVTIKTVNGVDTPKGEICDSYSKIDVIPNTSNKDETFNININRDVLENSLEDNKKSTDDSNIEKNKFSMKNYMNTSDSFKNSLNDSTATQAESLEIKEPNLSISNEPNIPTTSAIVQLPDASENSKSNDIIHDNKDILLDKNSTDHIEKSEPDVSNTNNACNKPKPENNSNLGKGVPEFDNNKQNEDSKESDSIPKMNENNPTITETIVNPTDKYESIGKNVEQQEEDRLLADPEEGLKNTIMEETKDKSNGTPTSDKSRITENSEVIFNTTANESCSSGKQNANDQNLSDIEHISITNVSQNDSNIEEKINASVNDKPKEEENENHNSYKIASSCTEDNSEPQHIDEKVNTNMEFSTKETVTNNFDKNSDKRKYSTEENTDTQAKKKKIDENSNKPCVRPKAIGKIHKGATFWPSTFRQKLCTCKECLNMYKDLSVLFLIDPEDTVSAYENLGKEKTHGKPSSQYEKGLQALSSLDRMQQINALTEYNKMRDKLIDFFKSFKDRNEIVKEEDIKSFFAGMKPKREPDGVYFCR